MEITIGKTAGFCYGVKRAVEGSIYQIENNKNQQIYCLGELVNNKQVVLELEKKGIKFIQEIEEIKEENAKLIIRAHGTTKEIYEKAKEKNIEIIDYTCPNVLKVHKIAEEYQKQGYYIFLTGTENHPEIIGTKSYCGKNFNIITTEEDLEKAIKEYKKTKIKKLLLISQTTYSVKKFENIKNTLNERINKENDLVIKNTICLTTEQRQKEAKELSTKVNKMIIIGGKNSSNTKKLYETAIEKCKNTICIETKTELEKIEKLEETDNSNIEKIGIMAGASTPQNIIDEVVNYINNKN